jgi:hypothetical protein
MTTAFVAIAESIKDKLLEAPQITADRVERGRIAELKRGWANGIVVRLVRTRGELAGVGPGAPKDWTTLYGIDIFARAATPEAAEDAVDILLAAAYARLAAYAIPGQSVEDVAPDPAIQWDTQEGEDVVCRASFVLSVVHRTAAATLTAWPS